MATHSGTLTTAIPTGKANLGRLALQFDGAACAVMGVALAAGAAPLAEFTGFPVAAELALGLALLPYGVWLFLRARRDHGRRMLLTIAALNVAWVIASALILLLGQSWLTTGGGWLVGITALLVADIAAVQFYAARKAK
jgi:hypothetical protein